MIIKRQSGCRGRRQIFARNFQTWRAKYRRAFWFGFYEHLLL